MYLRPPGAIATQFGAGSLAAHLHGAAVRELEAIALPVGGLERDIDTPDDLAALLRSGHECATTRVCHSLGIAEVMSGATGSR
jgi:2-phospho-L-lactate guanylyltransferase (CobY/MobA/RfbA family)